MFFGILSKDWVNFERILIIFNFLYTKQSWENHKKRYAFSQTLDSGEIFKGMPHGRLLSLSTLHPILGFSLYLSHTPKLSLSLHALKLTLSTLSFVSSLNSRVCFLHARIPRSCCLFKFSKFSDCKKWILFSKSMTIITLL